MNIEDQAQSADVDQTEVVDPPSESLLRRGQRVIGIDRAVFYGIVLRVWQLMAGLVTAVLITQCFSEELQGYYYAFFSIAAMQTFFELGLFMLALNISSHEWAKLSLGKEGYIEGDVQSLSRLVSFGRNLFKWYAAASIAFVAVVGPIGIWFFANSEGAESVQWSQPWIVFIVLSGLLLWILPFNSMLEGCGQVTAINKFRLFQAIAANMAVWICLVSGGNLWTAVGLVAARLVCELYLLTIRYRRFFKPFFQKPTEAEINWRKEVLPLQYRFAVTGIAGYFAFYMFVPVLFKFHGPALGGQMGMTWMVMMAIQGAALAWVQTKAPLMGTLVAENRIADLDQLFYRSTIRAVIALALAAIGVLAAIYGLHYWNLELRNRLLDPIPAGIFLLGLVIYQIPVSQTIYVRAHKQEPFVAASVITSLSIGGLVLLLGSRWGAVGAALAYLSVVSLFTLPVFTTIWLRFKKQWQLNQC